ncbi:uncharacterized protein LOC131879217 [Tigriopus californicus]|uniref:uncharacterized protein LOC131879217 n=1 Tax=Tigriopus californicus TaxID=6832 RepID=UPI0027DA699B|nr:uncharacterized protein LOC131879217 [Tigriopus californicus]
MKSSALWIFFLSLDLIEANIRCYSCAPCHEFEHFAGDLSYFERDCFLDRSCMKITGTARDEYGYEREVSVRGCPVISGLTNLEQGCTETSFQMLGIGWIQGNLCFCDGHLCNTSDWNTRISILVILSCLGLSLFWNKQ